MKTYKVNFRNKTDKGFKLERIEPNGYSSKQVDIAKEDLPKLMSELCMQSGEEGMIDLVRSIKNTFGLKQIKVTRHD